MHLQRLCLPFPRDRTPYGRSPKSTVQPTRLSTHHGQGEQHSSTASLSVQPISFDKHDGHVLGLQLGWTPAALMGSRSHTLYASQRSYGAGGARRPLDTYKFTPPFLPARYRPKTFRASRYPILQCTCTSELYPQPHFHVDSRYSRDARRFATRPPFIV